jgi:adenosylcobinamide kinase/adenosylcobinamide-phosphate guanylyltransferase
MSDRKIIFIIGGARSGKSSFALKEASGIPGKKAYVATAEALDEEMRNRIAQHKKIRGKDWDTYEEPIKIAGLIRQIGRRYNVLVIDCLTLWVSNLMHAGLPLADAAEELRKVLIDVPAGRQADSLIYIISNEVGSGIVPENEMARKFRDMQGMLNQEIAEAADEVYAVVAGIPLKIKGDVKSERRDD